jgi:predicted transcriptional regulator
VGIEYQLAKNPAATDYVVVVVTVVVIVVAAAAADRGGGVTNHTISTILVTLNMVHTSMCINQLLHFEK